MTRQQGASRLRCRGGGHSAEGGARVTSTTTFRRALRKVPIARLLAATITVYPGARVARFAPVQHLLCHGTMFVHRNFATPSIPQHPVQPTTGARIADKAFPFRRRQAESLFHLGLGRVRVRVHHNGCIVIYL